MRRMRTWSFSLIVCLTAACGNSVDLDDFESAVLDAVCSNAVNCGRMPDTATCKAAIQIADKELLTILAKAKSGAITYSSDKAGECVDMIQSRACEFAGFYNNNNPCSEVFVGKAAAGAACVVDLECATRHYCEETNPQCDRDTTCCAGTCKAIPAEVAIGGDCSAAPCVDGAYCSNSTDKCAALIATEGTACDSFIACANPMYCNIFLQAPVCERPASRGATCDPRKLIPCADNRDYCDATTMKCTQVSAVGGTCGISGPDCVSYATCTGNMCVADAKAGESCTYDPQRETDNCLGDLSCSANGSPCTLPATGTACPREDLTSAAEVPTPQKTIERSGFAGPRSAPEGSAEVVDGRALLRAHEEKARARFGGVTWIRLLD
jgi:hypothetical protein